VRLTERGWLVIASLALVLFLLATALLSPA
jgi:hypothetical protein